MLVCFVPFWILFFKDFNVAPDGDITNFSYKYRVWTLIYSWTAMQGFFNCIIFFVNSVEARERWKTWLSKYICCADKGLSDRQEMLSMWSEDFLTDDDMVKIPSTSHTSASGSTGLSTTSSLSSSSYLSSGVSSRFTEESVNSAI